MTIETAKFARNTDFTVVNDVEDEMEIAVETELVDDLARKANLHENLAAIALATVEKARMLSSSETRIERKISDRDLIDTLAILERGFEIQTLCNILETLKYFQIKKIVKSDNPIEELEEYF